ncbi:MAG: hypothetical protein CM15mV95_350 [Caudoviricetes sp.]|nr:MAG: hypothetical protein CM15mV95_350 [Caudoviricetes sp.]
MERLYREDPAEFVKQKAEQDRRKELQVAAQQEQDRIRQEKQQESEKVYSQYLENERKLLAEKLPIYSDKDKVQFVKTN